MNENLHAVQVDDKWIGRDDPAPAAEAHSDLVETLFALAASARADGWTVNFAVETGPDGERATLSVAKAP